MTKVSENKIETNDLKLQEDLERRFGEALAQELMAEIKKADDMSNGSTKEIPGYCGVKALSEGAEIYRREAQGALERLKTWRRCHTNGRPGIVEWDGAFLLRQFERKRQFYMRFHKSYFILYRQAMDAYRVAGGCPHKEVRTDQAKQATVSQAA